MKTVIIISVTIVAYFLDIVLDIFYIKLSQRQPKRVKVNSMKIKRILGLILFAFIGVLALASCNSKESFETTLYGKTYKGDLYRTVDNGYLLISDSKFYRVEVIEYDRGKILDISELNIVNLEKLDDNTWVYQRYGGSPRTYIVLINNGQELLQIYSGDYVSVYLKTDHIEVE